VQKKVNMVAGRNKILIRIVWSAELYENNGLEEERERANINEKEFAKIKTEKKLKP